MTSAMIADPTMPWLATALDCRAAQIEFKALFPHLQGVTQAHLVRHKPGRRALIAYHLETSTGNIQILGKIRAKGTDRNSYHCQRALWEKAFGDRLGNHFAVPEPLGVVEPWRMWLQRHVPGEPLTALLPTDRGLPLMAKVAALSHKIHCHPVPTTRQHTLADELRILGDRLQIFAQQQPQWQSLVLDFLRHSEQLGKTLEKLSLPTTTIHRDFYADQILVDGDRLWLVDLDLYCLGNPAVDLGNFIAHITEQSLRTYGNPVTLANRERALKIAFCQHHPGDSQPMGEAIDIYTTLTLLRHIAISARIPERRPNIPLLIDLCSDRLGHIP
ncbi:phosphotransferase, putative [[Synechococcus] sp. NIES-970]|nr:phosphotransferase, putative [[Synechococcus] sp. NIES-970]